MLFDEERPVKKPVSIWELKQVLEVVDERLKQLSWHRSEVAGGELIWSNKEAKKEFFGLQKKRGAILSRIASVKLD